ncbi:ABC transporter G family member 11-like [Dorcoceras hygrometricum]|uniref:ABC transporter G family member 11-like n=1 Tax=Dorcoceras hygrometricum TaxID=472368 RepID=A0A2Z7B967_9LAMI|nr:ABC transporter G family member 11-like [Dorcoceras hygrometricum]
MRVDTYSGENLARTSLLQVKKGSRVLLLGIAIGAELGQAAPEAILEVAPSFLRQQGIGSIIALTAHSLEEGGQARGSVRCSGGQGEHVIPPMHLTPPRVPHAIALDIEEPAHPSLVGARVPLDKGGVREFLRLGKPGLFRLATGRGTIYGCSGTTHGGIGRRRRYLKVNGTYKKILSTARRSCHSDHGFLPKTQPGLNPIIHVSPYRCCEAASRGSWFSSVLWISLQVPAIGILTGYFNLYRSLRSYQRPGGVVTRIMVFSRKHNLASIPSYTCPLIDVVKQRREDRGFLQYCGFHLGSRRHIYLLLYFNSSSRTSGGGYS